MKYLIFLNLLFGVLFPVSFCMDGNFPSIKLKIGKKLHNDFAMPIKIEENHDILLLKNKELVKGSFAIQDIRAEDPRHPDYASFITKLATVLSCPCELTFVFSAKFYSTGLIKYICDMITSSKNNINIKSIVVSTWEGPRTNKDLVAFAKMIFKLPKLLKLDIIGVADLPPSLLLWIVNHAKHLEVAHFDLNFFKLRTTDSYIKHLEHFTYSHQSLKELNLFRSAPLYPKEFLLLVRSMRIEKLEFNLNISQCTKEDVMSIEHSEIIFAIKLLNITIIVDHEIEENNHYNAEKFLFALALKLKLIQNLRIENWLVKENEMNDSILTKFLNTLPSPELLVDFYVTTHPQIDLIDNGVIDRFYNLERFNPGYLILYLPEIPMQKMSELVIWSSFWNQSLAYSFPNIVKISLRDFVAARPSDIYSVANLFRLKFIKEFTVELRHSTYMPFFKAISELPANEINFHGMLDISFGKSDIILVLTDSDAALIIDVLNKFEKSFVNLQICCTLASRTDIFEGLINRIPIRKRISVKNLECDCPLSFEKIEVNSSWNAKGQNQYTKKYNYKDFIYNKK